MSNDENTQVFRLHTTDGWISVRAPAKAGKASAVVLRKIAAIFSPEEVLGHPMASKCKKNGCQKEPRKCLENQKCEMQEFVHKINDDPRC